MRPPFHALLATTLGCVALLVVSCSPTEVPREAPGESTLSFDVQDVIRDVTAQAGPTFAPEVPVDSPVYSTASFAPRGHQVAHAGGIYLVVWSFEYTNEAFVRRHQIMATRVRALDGAVLDPGGVVLALNVPKEPHPAVASDGTNFLVTWEAGTEPLDPYNPDSFIFARRVSGTTGALLEPEPFRVSAHSGKAVTPALAFDGSHYLVVWNWDNSLILGARVRASDGAVLDPDGLLLSSATGVRFSPSVAFSEGQYLVVWQDHRTSSSAIYGTRVRASDGAVLEPSGTYISFGTSWDDARLPVIAARDGTFLVVWNSWQSSAWDGVRVAASDGRPVELAFRIAQRPGLSQHALVSTGTCFQLVWSEYVGFSDRDLFGVKIPVASGVPFDSKRLMGSATDDEASPALAMGDNQLLAVWFEARNTQQILALRMEPSSLSALDARPLLCSTEANAQRAPAMAVGTSNTLVVWADTRNRPHSSPDTDPYDLYGVRVRNSDGVVLDSTPIPIARAVSAQILPVVAFDGGNYLVVWLSGMPTGASHVVRGARVRASDGVVLDPTGVDISISTLASANSRPALAFGGGAYLVSWVSPDVTSIQGAYLRVVQGAPPQPIQFSVSSLESAPWPQPTTLSAAYASNLFLVVWDERRAGSSNIYGRRIQYSGGGPRPLDPVALALSTLPGAQLSPSVASSGSAFLVAWLDQRSSDALYGTRVNARDGKVLDEAGLALNTGNASKGPPSVAFDGLNYALTWSNSWPAAPSLKLMRVSPQGTLLDGTGQTITETSPAFHSGLLAGVAALGVRQFLVSYARFDEGLRQSRIKLRWLPATQPNGASCTGASECASGTCNPSGVCCDRLCTSGACGGGVCTDAPLRITCPADPVAEAADASGVIVSYQVQAEGPGRLSVAYSQYPGTLFSLGTTLVTATVMDGLGQTASCAFQVHVRDTTAPTLACPAPVTAKASSPSGATVHYPPATASDSVSAAVTLGYSQGSGTRFALGTTPVTVTATDAAGNASTCGFDVIVRPPAPPQVACPGDVRAEATSPSGSPVYYAPATAQGMAPLALSYSRASGTRIALGTTPITATVTDGLGRTASCVFQVHVRDTTEPSLSCPDPVTAEATSPSGASVNYPPATASDTVSAVTIGYSHASGTHFAVGTTPVTVTATDASGNSRTCDFEVTVRQSDASSVMTGASGPL